MKAFLRHVLINLLVILTVNTVYPGFVVLLQPKTLLTASVIWLILNKIVKPVIKLFLLPINLITLNLFSWAVSLITLFLLPLLVGEIKITPYYFPGINQNGFAIPPMQINLFFSYFITSFFFNFFHGFLIWLIKKDSD